MNGKEIVEMTTRSLDQLLNFTDQTLESLVMEVMRSVRNQSLLQFQEIN